MVACHIMLLDGRHSNNAQAHILAPSTPVEICLDGCVKGQSVSIKQGARPVVSHSPKQGMYWNSYRLSLHPNSQNTNSQRTLIPALTRPEVTPFNCACAALEHFRYPARLAPDSRVAMTTRRR